MEDAQADSEAAGTSDESDGVVDGNGGEPRGSPWARGDVGFASGRAVEDNWDVCICLSRMNKISLLALQ